MIRTRFLRYRKPPPCQLCRYLFFAQVWDLYGPLKIEKLWPKRRRRRQHQQRRRRRWAQQQKNISFKFNFDFFCTHSLARSSIYVKSLTLRLVCCRLCLETSQNPKNFRTMKKGSSGSSETNPSSSRTPHPLNVENSLPTMTAITTTTTLTNSSWWWWWWCYGWVWVCRYVFTYVQVWVPNTVYLPMWRYV